MNSFTVQWRALGIEQFLLTYGLGISEHGYGDSSFEAIASETAARFDADNLPVTGLAEIISEHAMKERELAAQTFKRYGLSFTASMSDE